ncbi:Uncharacterized protein BAE44_0000525 [Dichanthelium oligosanthes]|uniref:BAR domain-containing protein n=1 Tax=Dichanthelium oligosanthes TaxID=888268 RepID=A0A1E5WM60_9POAL|nr:Uncharacterized protein BAE44_0000525 [Dichanthelium oligosanthes]
MKSPLRRFRGFGHHHREKKDHGPPPAKLDELVYAAQTDLEGVIEVFAIIYDKSLKGLPAEDLIHEFSEAMEEMGTCLLEKAALNYDDDESGRVLMMLGKAQFGLQKFVDSYVNSFDNIGKFYHNIFFTTIILFNRTNIINTIANPSESLLKELQVVEEMKDQCDEKSGNTTTYHRLDFQISFFRRGLKHLEALEPYVKAVAEKQHIDYHFSGLDDDSDVDDYSSYQDNHSDGSELSFDYEINDRDKDLPSSRSPMDLDQAQPTSSPRPLKEHEQENAKEIKVTVVVPHVKPEIVTQSAPIFAENVPDPSTRIRRMNLSSRTIHSYKLPTPADEKNPTSVVTNTSPHSDPPASKSHVAVNLWHSSPLVKDFKPSSMYRGPVKMPSNNEGISAPLVYSYSTSDFKKMKREAFSGPIPSKTGLSNPLFSATDRRQSMNYPSRVLSTKSHGPGWQSSLPPKVTPRVTSLPTTPPKISELHELPRPPANVGTIHPGLVGYSGPLVSRRQIPNAPNRVSPPSRTASPLPRPPAAMTRSYSIPSNSQRTPIITVNKLLESRHSRESSEVSSPPLTPISLADVSRRSTAETIVDNKRTKVIPNSFIPLLVICQHFYKHLDRIILVRVCKTEPVNGLRKF